MDFLRSEFGTNEPLPVEHFFLAFGRFAVCAQQKVRKKCLSGRGLFVPKLFLTKSTL